MKVLQKASYVVLILFIASCVVITSSYGIYQYSNYLGILFVFLRLLYLLINKKTPDYKLSKILFFSWGTLFLYGLFTLTFYPQGWEYLFTFFQIIVLFFFILEFAKNYKIESAIFYGLISGSLLIFVLGYEEILAIIQLRAYRFSFEFYERLNISPNSLGVSFAFTILFLVKKSFIDKQNKRRYVIYVTSLIALLILSPLITGSKKALLASLIILFLLFVLTTIRKGNLKKQIQILLPLVVLIVVAVSVSLKTTYIKYRIDNFVSAFTVGKGAADISTNARLNIIDKGLEIISDDPFIGHGVNSFREIAKLDYYSHNNYIELAVSFGVFSLLLYYYIHFYILYKNRKLYKNHYKVLKYRMVYIWVIFFIGLIIIMDIAAGSYYEKLNAIMLAYLMNLTDDKTEGVIA